MQDNYAHEYGELQKWHWWFQGRNKIIESLLRTELTSSSSRRLLSVGCGPAAGLKWLVRFAGDAGEVVGLDLETRHARDFPEQVQFVVGSLEAAPLKAAAFDVVLALDVLEHLDDDFGGLAEAVRLVKPGGLLLLTVPAIPSLWGRQDVVSHHRRRYDKRTLQRLLDKTSLDYRIRYFNTFFFPVAASIRWTRRLLGTANRAGSDFAGAHPGFVNDILAWVFSSERHLLDRGVLPIGVSLAAICRRPILAGET